MLFGLIKSLMLLGYGKYMFSRSAKKYHINIDKDIVFFFMRESKMLNYLCLKYMELAAKEKDIVIISSDVNVLAKCTTFSHGVKARIELSENTIGSIIKYLTCKGVNNIVICSLNIPFGRFGYNYLKNGSITLEEMVYYGILKLKTEDLSEKISPNPSKKMATEFLKSDRR